MDAVALKSLQLRLCAKLLTGRAQTPGGHNKANKSKCVHYILNFKKLG